MEKKFQIDIFSPVLVGVIEVVDGEVVVAVGVVVAVAVVVALVIVPVVGETVVAVVTGELVLDVGVAVSRTNKQR
jgi:hypothetical protein